MKDETINFWTNLFAKQKESGLTQSKYCTLNNISYKYFSNMKVKIKQAASENSSKFVKIPVKIQKDFSTSGLIELFINGKYKINIHTGFDHSTLRKLLEIIEGIS